MSENQYLTVTALTKYLKYKFDQDPYLQRIYLTGELSNFRLRPNAHQYFSLKDEKAKISAIMFKGAFQKLKFQPKEGMKVLVIGRVSLYEASGQYQIYVEHMEPDGIGALYQALAEMKEKLAKEGLFSVPKKSLPKFPKRIAVITSPSGAVVRDIMTTVKRRYPIVELVVFPTLVQGDRAAQSIVENIYKVEKLGNFDTLIIARGGGSIEDLWPFNEERVARAIAGAEVPVISSVGHETDTTIADLVADVRAATPTAAAELSVPNLSEELLKIKEKENRLLQAFIGQIRHKQQRLLRPMDSYVFKQPHRLYESVTLKLDRMLQQFQQNSKAVLDDKQKRLDDTAQRLLMTQPRNQIVQSQQQLDFTKKQLLAEISRRYEKSRKDLLQATSELDLLSPLKIMSRGYGYVTEEKKIIHSVTQLTPDSLINIHFSDGVAEAKVLTIEEKKEG
ncbi:exodeoxyribonuclease VII large subunit [Vagococcus elongatus]|uniref:Exodeoxyribonuclease 7 large subunit n=1 Tax=Vagococcus elongatus TaxID=180344 RepID=A0A430AYD2_9ENTE|nr:exodeoxyribonuclease VII large subunit [Vagococcus elongatus]RSU13045.1 exodeoxyribonuclease VII large subunit [Vagococcus elongatus]